MINWIIGGGIVAVTIYIIVRSVIRLRKGESTCCGDCTQKQCNCSKGH